MSFDSNVETIANVTSTDVQHSTINKENVQVSSEISHDSTNKVSLNIGNDRLNQLLDNLSTTQAQFDDYTQRRTQQISRETKHIIQRILDETKVKQRELLLEAQAKAQQFQDDYQNQLQIKVDEFNQQKAQNATNARLEQITEQVVSIGQKDSAYRLASTTTTTVITTQATAQGQSGTYNS